MLDGFMPSLLLPSVMLVSRRGSGREFIEMPVSAASTNARRHAEIGALCK